MHEDAQVIVDYCRDNAKRDPREAFTIEAVDLLIASIERQLADPRFKAKQKAYKKQLAKYQVIKTFFETASARAE
ncbi:MAG: hypothetical protein AAGA36_00290 [Pseudomonadota bacterium]